MKKLFVFDCDGTLINDNRELLPETIAALRNAAHEGHYPVICTGRGINQLRPYLNQIKIVCTCNGGIINFLETGDEIINGNPIARDVINDLIDIAMKHKRELQWTNDNQEMYRVYFGTTPEQDIQDQSFFQLGTKNPVYDKWEDVRHTLNDGNIIHIAVKMETSKIDEPFNFIHEKYHKSQKYNVVKTGDVYIDVDPWGVNKATAVKLIQRNLGIKNENTYCFGDSDNDISMVEYAGTGVALWNATQNLKNVADVIIGSNNEPAIATYVSNVISQTSNKVLEPSLLAFDIDKLQEQLEELKQEGIDTIHYDVMDGYVNNKSFDIEHMQLIKDMGFEIVVHFMVYDPMQWIERFAQFKPEAITFQYEAVNYSEAMKVLKKIKSYGIKAGIAIKPYSKYTSYSHLLDYVDFLTMMTVEPGKGGQSFIDDALNNVKYVHKYRKENNLRYKIEVDGGIKLDNVYKVLPYVDYVVSGSGYMGSSKTARSEFVNKVMGENND